MSYAITAQAISKQYNRYPTHRPRTFMEAVLWGPRRRQPVERFWALREVSFAVAPGQMLGVVGQNGAGKSTLLQILSGVVSPDQGKVLLRGRMGALLDLGAGFHPDLTGRENLYVSAIVAGLTRREAERQFDAILSFAELEAFIDNPVRTYSTGMQMRLAFAVAIHTQPDVLLVDEFLSVGDLAFQAKCLERIAQLKGDGCAVVLISHNIEQIQLLCDQAIWLEQGAIRAYGEPNSIASQFTGVMELQHQTQEFRSYSRRVELTALRLWTDRGLPATEIQSGDPLTIELDYLAHQSFETVIFSISISDEAGQIYFNTNTETPGLRITLQPGGGKIQLQLERLDLRGGVYGVNAGIFAADWSETYDYHWHFIQFQIGWTPNEQTILYPPRRWLLLNRDETLELRSL